MSHSHRTSGANTTPLGRSSSGSSGSSSHSSSKSSSSKSSKWSQDDNWSSNGRDRSRDREREQETDKDQERKRKRRSRWGGDEKEKVFIPGLPTVLPNNLNPQQERAYLLQLQIEEISRRLRTGDLGISPNPEERSPSPEPIYNSEGKRLNTREYRTRKKLEDDRHSLIQEMYSCNPEYKPPPDYKPPLVKVCEKVMIPQEEHPDINFVGLLIGPRGNTLKSMEKETGAKIIIRGKGSVKEGKVGRKDGQPLPGEDEPLHAFVTGNSNESVKKAVNKIREIIRQGVEVPEGQNDLRRMQLRELALLNGTLRENDGPRCTNCGGTTHRSWQCPDKPNITNSILCTNCGSAGHIAKDCREQKAPGGLGAPDKAKIDEEYMSLMAELGEGPPPPNKANNGSTSQPSMSALQAPPGPPRAIMAPPPTSMQSTQSMFNNNQNKSTNVVRSVPPPTTMMQNQMFMPPPIMSQMPPPPLPPTSTNVPMGMPPWNQPPFQGVPPVGLLPPPPPPNMQGGNQGNWMQPQGNQGSPWNMQQGGPMPVPPPPGIAPPPPTMYPWGTFMGVPPPPPLQSTLQSLAAQPPPPPPPSSSATATNVTLATLSLPSLLSAPPPPPPPPPS
ncbi:hypothetical protein JTE90_008976 [Oedothorax gibbosus]|uniref:Branchpoint-bridging protein n=1 Tax=Oedothorax gibbosus TaxID=931172 RepID=A0AAV6UIP6_9ARAC|nr:hypothetical protein JTE90_008976 [Oedothorax gibbosus]